ncbi:MAG TPA: BON domain-containing protein [Alphaproteobacteria bacterium]|nr:BON domain-containing protein [Alphaproteobacteria bacterium]
MKRTGILTIGMILVTVALLTAGCSRLGLGARPDAQITSDVQNKINSDASIPDKQITVAADNGVVTLSGTVSSDAVRNTAANDAAQIAGVKTVVNNLTVAAAASTAPEPAPEPSKPAPARRASSTRRPSPASREGQSSGSASSAPDSASTAPSTAPVAASVPATPPPPAKITIPAGTQIGVRISSELSSETAQLGDTFHGSVYSPVAVDGQTVIPTTADLEGRVVEVKSAGRFAGQSELVLELTKVIMDGKTYSIRTDQWTKAGNKRGKATAAKVGGGAAVGAILGGIFGGGKGAAIGAAAGAGAGTGVAAANKGQQIILKPETVLNFSLESPLTVTPGAPSNRRSMN